MSDADDRPLPPEGLTYYQLLGVSEEAPENDIQNAYRQLIKIYHPDQWDHWASEDVARRLREGYDVLTDPRARQRYNQVGHEDYTGESAASISDIREWVNAVNRLIDVEHPVTMDEVDEGDEGTIDIEDGFETSEESMSAEEIFDEIDADLDPTSFDEVKEEAQDETHSDGTPDYASETGVDDIANEGRFDAAKPESGRETTEASYEEEVKEKANSRRRAHDPTAEHSEDGHEETSTSSSTRTAEPDSSSVIKGARRTATSVYATVEQYLSDDVLSRAVRRAWMTRSAAVIGLIAVEVLAGIAASRANVGLMEGVLPSFADPTGSIPVVLLTAAVVFAVDQFKTETDTNRGAINVAETPSYLGGLAVTGNAVGAVLFAYAASRGHDPFAAIAGIANGTLPVGVWLDVTGSLGPIAGGAVANGLVAIVAGATIGLGFLFGVGAVTRYVWYCRYVSGFRILPAWWDAALAVPMALSLLVLATGITEVPIPGGIAAPIVGAVPSIAAQLGLTADTAARDAVFSIALSSPAIVGSALYARTLVERGIRRALGQ